VITHHHHLLTLRQVDRDDRVGQRHQLSPPRKPGVPVPITPAHATTVGHERPPVCDGTLSPTSAAGGRSYVQAQRAERVSMPPSGRIVRQLGSRLRRLTA
jgi:hypothetical protein